MSSPALPSVEALRAEPFRLFFPLAFLLGAAGVVHWVMFTSGAMERYLGVFHAVTQMQSFMLAFAAGFLLTAIPKRTRSAPATLVEIGALAALIPAVSLATLYDRLAVAELAYAAALVVLAQFAIRRFLSRTSGRRPPASFAAVPVGFAAGLAGAGLIVAATRGAPGFALSLGRALALEGMFECVVVGIGSFFFALALRGDPPGDTTASKRDRLAMAVYALAALAILGGLVLQDLGFVRAGLLVRALVIGVAFARSGVFRRPVKRGLNRRLLRLAALAIPAGLVAAALVPEHRIAAMHVAFVGGFGLLAFAVAAHVTLGHSGFTAQQDGRPWPVAAFGILFVAAAAMRATAPALPDAYFRWLGAAAVVWLLGAAVWALYLLPKMWAEPAAENP